MSFSFRTLAALVAVLTLVLTACGGGEDTTEEAGSPAETGEDDGAAETDEDVDAAAGEECGPFHIGVAAALSGPAASFGTKQVEVIERITEIVNDEGGINGRPIELHVVDTKTDPTEAARIVTQLVRENEDIIGMFGSTTSSESLAFLPITVQEDVTVLVPGSAPPIGDPDEPWFPLTFRAAHPITTGNELAVNWMLEDGVTRAAGLFQDDAVGETGREHFEQLVEETEGLELAEVVSVSLDASDATTQIRRILNSNPDGVYVETSSSNQLQASALRALENAGYEGEKYGPAGAGQRELLETAGSAAEGLKLGVLVNPDDLGALEKLEELMEPLGGIQNHGHLTGAQGFNAIIEGLRDLEGCTNSGQDLATAIENHGPIEGYGPAPIEYTPDDHDGWGPEALLRVVVQDGEFVTVER